MASLLPGLDLLPLPLVQRWRAPRINECAWNPRHPELERQGPPASRHVQHPRAPAQRVPAKHVDQPRREYGGPPATGGLVVRIHWVATRGGQSASASQTGTDPLSALLFEVVRRVPQAAPPLGALARVDEGGTDQLEYGPGARRVAAGSFTRRHDGLVGGAAGRGSGAPSGMLTVWQPPGPRKGSALAGLAPWQHHTDAVCEDDFGVDTVDAARDFKHVANLQEGARIRRAANTGTGALDADAHDAPIIHLNIEEHDATGEGLLTN
eukprot:scaffold2610_cov115-Isochrysis_galbana.AAC.8